MTEFIDRIGHSALYSYTDIGEAKASKNFEHRINLVSFHRLSGNKSSAHESETLLLPFIRILVASSG